MSSTRYLALSLMRSLPDPVGNRCRMGNFCTAENLCRFFAQ
jgi:hypothetical protein